jgi:hypothetical protein
VIKTHQQLAVNIFNCSRSDFLRPPHSSAISESPRVIPLANLLASDVIEREKKTNERKNREGTPRGEDPCHSKHKPSVQCLKKQLE